MSIDVQLPSLITLLSRRKEPMSVKEFAAFLHVSNKSVYDSIKRDAFPVIRFGGTIRIDPVHAAKWLRERQVK